jgi:hypothetical protein
MKNKFNYKYKREDLSVSIVSWLHFGQLWEPGWIPSMFVTT